MHIANIIVYENMSKIHCPSPQNTKFPDDMKWARTSLAVVNGGGIRSSIDERASNGTTSGHYFSYYPLTLEKFPLRFCWNVRIVVVCSALTYLLCPCKFG